MSEVNAGIVRITHQANNLHVTQKGAPGVSVRTGGPQGAKGDPGSASESYVAARDIGGHRVAVLDANVHADYATADNATHAMRVIGITQGAVKAGEPVSILTRGPMKESSWSWDVQRPVYLSSNGLLTQVQPASPLKFSMVIGFPMAADTLYVNPGPAINLAQ